MDESKYMIVIKGKIRTREVTSCEENMLTGKIDVTYSGGKCYSYSGINVIFMRNPEVFEHPDFMIEVSDGKRFSDIRRIYQFKGDGVCYWTIECANGFKCSYKKSDLNIHENCLADKKSANVFAYLKDISALNEITNDNGEYILSKYYQRIAFVPEETALSVYLNTTKQQKKYDMRELIFPFGCNQSQYNAVKNALTNQISIIQGPPGTGKTQTILNIIANLIIKGKSVIVVSNNNSATQNVLDKLSKEKYGMNFMVAPLGNSQNKNTFIEKQSGIYPNLSSWEVVEDREVLLSQIRELSQKMQHIYELQEKIARLKEKHYEIELEMKHFDEFAKDTGIDYKRTELRRNLSPDKLMQLWMEAQEQGGNNAGKLSFLFKLKCFLFYGIANWKFYNQDISTIIPVFQGLYYKQSLKAITENLETYEKELEQNMGDYGSQLEEKSLAYLKNIIVARYDWKNGRKVFSEDDLFRNPCKVLNEYPIVLSTTFSARASLNTEYDYVIMDEASQVDVATGALALSCAENAVIVGDTKQLPNVVTEDVKQKADVIMTKYSISSAYNFSDKSFLQSIIEAIPDVSSTLLREHYRCHPRIISFCNQKFYNNELVVMTEDDNLGNALMAVKTVAGNHARNNYNQRQIDVIKEEILPNLDEPSAEIGIITPYNAQVNEIKKQIPEIETATVHKFQGREKNVIILSTVDNQIKDFTDDPYLLNVAVSRAKKQLIVVISGNEQAKNGNIVDLISYIRYNKMEVIDSKIYSVFDYLYSQYREKRWEMLKSRKKISQYDSENLTYMMLQEVLKDYPEYGIQCFEPLAMIVRDFDGLSDREIKYILNPLTHVDFMIFNKISKQPIAAVETDGYKFHEEGTVQHERDLMKDHIFKTIGLKIIRLKTNESNEKEKVISVLP